MRAAMLPTAARRSTESDPEVSEAVDFVEFYRRRPPISTSCRGSRPRAEASVVVVSPWNFPIAIPCGGVAAALAAGNTVILKPASDTVLDRLRSCASASGEPACRDGAAVVPCPGRAGGQ